MYTSTVYSAEESCEEDTLELTEYKSERLRVQKLKNKMKGMMEIQQAADRQPVVPDQVLLIQTAKMIYEFVQDKETIHANPAPAVALKLDCGSELVVDVADIVLHVPPTHLLQLSWPQVPPLLMTQCWT